MHFDEAFEFLVSHLASMEPKTAPGARVSTHGGDIWMPDIGWTYWASRIDRTDGRQYTGPSDLGEQHMAPLYEAAWELARIGVLRPGEAAPVGRAIAKSFGDLYTITGFGRDWLRQTRKAGVIDPSRLAQVLESFRQFGGGYVQRATEAVRTYRTGNYLATCVMSGAAAESILLALAIKKVGDEAKVLSDYNAAGGRRRITKRILGNVSPALGAQFEAALQVLHFWRDNAGHGTSTTISEIEAHSSLTQLLRLAQFATDRWDQLTR